MRRYQAQSSSPFRCFNSSPEVIRLAVLMYVRFPLSLRNVEDLLFERGIDVSYETVRFWWNRFGPLFAADIPPPAGERHARFPPLALDELFVRYCQTNVVPSASGGVVRPMRQAMMTGLSVPANPSGSVPDDL